MRRRWSWVSDRMMVEPVAGLAGVPSYNGGSGSRENKDPLGLGEVVKDDALAEGET